MKSSKGHIITEGLFSTKTPEACGEKLGKKIAKYLSSKDILSEFNGQIVDKSCFKWENVFKGTPTTVVKTGGNYGMRIFISYSYELKAEELKSFIFGTESKAGLIYNPNFEETLKNCGFLKEQDPIHKNDEGGGNDGNSGGDGEDDDFNESVSYNDILKIYNNIIFEEEDSSDDYSDEDQPEDESFGDEGDEGGEGSEKKNVPKMPESLPIKLKFVFNGFSLSNKVKDPDRKKPKNKFNSDYIVKCDGKAILVFGEGESEKIGSFTYFPKRTGNMEPKETAAEKFKKAFADAWNKAPADKITPGYDVSVVAAKMAGDALKGALGGIFTVQKEGFDFTLDKKYGISEIKLEGTTDEDDADNEDIKSAADDPDKIQNLLNAHLSDSKFNFKIKISDNYVIGKTYYSLKLYDSRGLILTINAQGKEIDD